MQDPGAVAGVDLGAGGAAVVEVAQGGEGLGHDVVAGLTGQGRHHGDATGVLLVARVVETLRRREVRRERVRRGHWFSRRRLSSPGAGPGRAGGWALPLGTTLARARRNLSPAHAPARACFRPWDRPSGWSSDCSRRRPRRRPAPACARPPRVRGGAARTRRRRAAASDEQHDRGPHVEPQPEHVVHLDVVDAEVLDPAAAGGVEHDVERGDPAVAEAEAPVQPDQHGEGGQVPQALVEERRVEGRDVEVAATGRWATSISSPHGRSVGRP